MKVPYVRLDASLTIKSHVRLVACPHVQCMREAISLAPITHATLIATHQQNLQKISTESKGSHICFDSNLGN